ncbi:hypothetical protein RJ639_041073 [Escallonia herrerae]|uniref:Uncharacterized protein n=1 Tax=Escallonia herrerae TaxID=1293975 RepID=A0AA89B7K2_9ASTE|nr:hypothetical protein RJ639_041073 [Escallonia herrerae]
MREMAMKWKKRAENAARPGGSSYINFDMLVTHLQDEGHVNPMMKLAMLLHHRGFHITFVNTEYNHRRLLTSRGPTSLDGLPDFRFETIPDGLRLTEAADTTQDTASLFYSTRNKELLGPVPQGPTIIRTRDLEDPMFDFVMGETNRTSQASALIFNTFDALEHDALEAISSMYACTDWGVGMEINGDVKRDEVEKKVRELMGGKEGEEMRNKAMEWKREADEAISLNGSSSLNLDKLLVWFTVSKEGAPFFSQPH